MSIHNLTARAVRDGTFKALFDSQELLVPFLNAAQRREGSERIQRVIFKDPFLPAFTPGEKNITADVACDAYCEHPKAKPEKHILEMQQILQPGHLQRWEFYAGRYYTLGLQDKGQYEQLLRVHITVVMGYPSPYSNDTYVLTGRVSKQTISGSRALTLLSLDKAPRTLDSNATPLDRWLHLLKYSGTPQLNVGELSKDPVLLQAIERLRALQAVPPQPIKEGMGRATTWSLLSRKARELPS